MSSLLNSLFDKFINIMIKLKCKFICCSKETIYEPKSNKNNKNDIKTSHSCNHKEDSSHCQSSSSYRKNYLKPLSESSLCKVDV